MSDLFSIDPVITIRKSQVGDDNVFQVLAGLQQAKEEIVALLDRPVHKAPLLERAVRNEEAKAFIGLVRNALIDAVRLVEGDPVDADDIHAVLRDGPMVSDSLGVKANELGYRSVATAALVAWEWLQREEHVFGALEISHYRPKERPNSVRIVHPKNGDEAWWPLFDEAGESLFPELMAELDAISRRPCLAWSFGATMCTGGQPPRSHGSQPSRIFATCGSS